MYYPIQACGLGCEQCPTAAYTYDVNHPLNCMTNEAMLNYVDRYYDPARTLFEISGGEPSLYPGIAELVKGLSDRGYMGVIRTNGSRPIPKTDNFQIVFAWHRKVKKPPENYDSIFVVRNPDDDWKGKVKYCEDNNIPFTCVKYQHFDGTPNPKGEYYDEQGYERIVKLIDRWSVIYSSGRIGQCYSNTMASNYTIFNMSPPVYMDLIAKCCKVCGPILGFELSLTNKMKARIFDLIKNKNQRLLLK